MKKNTVLYLVIIVLLIMNGFFLFNYLGKPNQKEPRASDNFIISELNFDDSQIAKFKILEEEYHLKMRNIRDAEKVNKDELFIKITAPTINENVIDSLISKISEKEELKEKELFNKLRGIYSICNDEQKQRFSDIIKKARRFNGNGPRPRNLRRPEPRR